MLRTMSPSHWIQSLIYEGTSGISLFSNVTNGNALDTPFGTSEIQGTAPNLAGYSGESVNWFPTSGPPGSGVFSGNIGYGDYALTGPGTTVQLHNNSVANLTLDGVAFPVGATRNLVTPCTFSLENAAADIHRVKMKVRHGRSYAYRLPQYALIYAWFHSSSKGKFWWERVHRHG